MYNGMLRQYGIATPTSLTPVHHPEDAQPNERGSKRTQKAPPRIAITAPPRGDSNGFQRGGYRGRSMYRGGPFTQYAVRGNSSWREGGHGQGYSRGTTRNTVMNNYQQVQASGIASTSNVHWSRQESGLSRDAHINRSAVPYTAVVSAASMSMNYTQQGAYAQKPQNHPYPMARSPASRGRGEGPSRGPTRKDHYRNANTSTVHWWSGQETGIPNGVKQIPAVNSTRVEAPSSKPETDIVARRRGQSSNMDRYPQAHASTLRVHWSRQEGSTRNMPVDIDSRPSTPDVSSGNSTEVEAPASKPDIKARSPPAGRPSIPRKRPASDHWSKQSATPPRNAQSPALHSTASQPLPEEHANGKDDAIIVSHEPEWYLRTRSPTPKLPPAPLKRRKLDDDPAPSPKSDIVVLVRTPSPKARGSIPLPGRKPTPARKKDAPIHVQEKDKKSQPSPSVKQEHRSPTPVEALKPERKLITESAQFYPMPESCRKVNPDFAQCRKAHFQEKSKELLRLGLRKTKAFWRDDGLVIEWTSTLPVWSDTLKPDTLDLATAIQRAYEVNDMRTHKRKRDIPASGSVSSDSVPQVTAASPDKKRGPAANKEVPKHWAAGVPLEDIESVATVSRASARAEKEKESPSKRLPLPTRAKPPSTSSSLPKPPFKLPDPTAVLPSKEWRAMAEVLPLPSKRMVFKPTNPRKSQTQDTAGIVEMGAPLPTRGRKDDVNGAESSQPVRNVDTHVGGASCTHETASTPAVILPLSRASIPRDRRTPESARSPTLINESVSRQASHAPIERLRNETLESMSISGSVSRDFDDRGAEGDDDCDLESVALDLLHGTPDPDGVDMDVSSDDGESVDEETEYNVQQFISKYASMFDSDRRSLKKAYAKDALFSCRVHHAQPNSCASLFIPENKDPSRSSHSRASLSQVIRGRTQICDQLLALGQYQFIPRGVPQNPMYTWSIPKMSGVRDGILLSLHGEVVKTGSTPAMDHRLAVDQTFLLRQRTDDDDTDDDDGTDIPGQTNLKNFWPLAVVSHQMAARSNPLLDVDELKGRLGWIHDILQ